MFLKKYPWYDAVLRNANRSFLCSIRDLYFCDLTEFRRFAQRKHSQSDAGMNLALFKFDRIIALFLSQNTINQKNIEKRHL